MAKKPKVNRSYYRSLSQNELSNFAQATANNMEGADKYTDLTTEIVDLKTKATTYIDALQIAEQGGRDRILTKDLAKQEVLHALNSLADGMDFFSKGDIQYFTDSKVPLQNAAVKYTGVLMPPFNIAIRATGEIGKIIVHFEIPTIQKSSVTNIGVEWSIDGGTTWQNGKYSTTKSRMTLTGMPSRELLMVRLRCLGTRGRVSEWSNSVTVSVA